MERVHPKYRTPHIATAITGVVAAIIAGLFPLDVLGELISIGILLAFAAVCAGVLVLRYTSPDTARPFRVPAAWLTCIAGRGRVSRHDALPAARHVDPVGDLDGHRIRHLRPLRLPPQPAAPHGRLGLSRTEPERWSAGLSRARVR